MGGDRDLAERLSLLHWLEWLGRIAGIIASLGNALALSVILEWAFGTLNAAGVRAFTGGLIIPTSILATAGSILAAVVVQRQTGIGPLRLYVKQQSLMRVN